MEIIFARATDFFFFYFYVYMYIYIHIRVLLQFLGLISEKSLSPERRGRPLCGNGSFTKKRKTNMFRNATSCNYIYPFLHTRAFSKILDSANGLKSIYIRRRLPRIFEFDLKIGLIPWRRTRNIRISGLARPKKRNIRRGTLDARSRRLEGSE